VKMVVVTRSVFFTLLDICQALHEGDPAQIRRRSFVVSV
jgi:hypothetical protein